MTPMARIMAWSAIALAASLPFLGKAFHIDDPLYLNGAFRILEDPLRPYGDPENSLVLWDAKDGRPSSLFDTDFNPPLWKYILAGAIAVGGPSETWLHAVSAIFLLAGGIAWGMLAHRWTSQPTWVVAMILWSPFFLPGQNLMLEVPVLCWTGWGVLLLVRAWDMDSRPAALGAGLFIGLAILTKYSAGILLPVWIAGSMIQRKYRSLVGLIVPVALLGVWCAHNSIIYGEWHLTSHGNFFRPDQWDERTFNVLRTIGGVSFLWPVFLSREGNPHLRSRWLLLGALLAFSCAVGDLWQTRLLYEQEGLQLLLVQEVHIVAMSFAGCFTLLLIAMRSLSTFRASITDWRGNPIDRWLEAWILVMLIFNVTCTPFNAVRHLLLALIPMTLLAARQATRPASRARQFALVLSTTLGFALAAADYELAGTYRELGQSRIRDDIAQGQRVWFTGNWGFAYYAEQEGARPFFDGCQEYGLGLPTVGDRIYNPVTLTWAPLPTKQLNWVEHLQPEGLVPLRTVAPGGNYFGMKPHDLPWQFLLLPPDPTGDRLGYQFPPLDHIRIWQVREPLSIPLP